MEQTPEFYALIGSVSTAVIGGIAWLCTKKCNHQRCSSNCGCIQFSSSEDTARGKPDNSPGPSAV